MRLLLALAASLALAAPARAADPIIDSMGVVSEALPHGADPVKFGWPAHPLVQWGNDPHGYGRWLPWLQVYADANGSAATNTRVEVMRLYGRILYAGGAMDGRWGGVATAAPRAGAMYPEDFSSNTTTPADYRMEPDGGVSVAIDPAVGKVLHTWTDSMDQIDAAHVACLYVTFQARLVIADPAKPDDRSQARYVASAGADYWKSDFSANAGAAIGWMQRVGPQYRTYGVTTCTADQLAAHPVPN